MFPFPNPALEVAAASGGVGSGNTALDPADNSATITLSNSNLTATKNATSGSAWSVAAHGKATGKWRFQATIVSAGGDMSVGLMGVGGEPAEYLGSCSRAICYNKNNGVLTSRSTQFAGTFTTGDVIDVYADVGAGKVWFAKNGTLVNGDPVAGTGGTSMSGMPKAWYPVVYLSGASTAVTLNFGDAAWVYSGSTGYNGWSAVDYAIDLTTFRSLRMGIASLGYYAHALAEWELMTTSGGSNILTGGTLGYGSGGVAGGSTANLLDGNTTTWFAVYGGDSNTSNQNQPPAWIGYDFGSNGTRNAAYLALRSRDGGGGAQTQCPTLIDIYLSDDNSAFWKVKPRVAFSAWGANTPGDRQEVAL